METYKSERMEYLDIMKGILIILVVLGHSPFEYRNILYWFHMPAFFIISGLLYKEKPINIFMVAKNIFIPYISFSIINIFCIYSINSKYHNLIGVMSLIKKHIFSGKVIGGVFWFIPVFFVTKILFDFFNKNIKNKYLGSIVVVFYVCAHIISIYLFPMTNYTRPPKYLVLPWNIDVVLIAIWYYFLGFKLKNYVNKIKSGKLIWYSSVMFILFMAIDKLYGINYRLDMKYSYYKFLALDTFIPILFIVFLIALSSKISIEFKSVSKVMAKIGRKSLYIMYLHIPINSLLLTKFNYEYTVYVLIGIFLPLLFSQLVESNRYSRLLFTGK